MRRNLRFHTLRCRLLRMPSAYGKLCLLHFHCECRTKGRLLFRLAPLLLRFQLPSQDG
mgnify:CR=1 FL=1